MDPGFVEFPQTPRGRIFSLLEFYSHLNVLLMFRLNEAVRGRLSVPKHGTELLEISLETFRGRFCTVRGYGLFGCRLC